MRYTFPFGEPENPSGGRKRKAQRQRVRPLALTSIIQGLPFRRTFECVIALFT